MSRRFHWVKGQGVVEVGAQPAQVLDRPIVSDAVGFIAQQLPDFERDRVMNNFHGIEFVPDPQVPQFIQVKCSSRKEFDRYVKHRGQENYSSKNGSSAMFSEGDLEKMAERIREKYPVPKE